MARIAGVDLPRDKGVEIALTYIYGIGRTTAKEIITECGLDPLKRVRTLEEDEVARLRDIIEKHHKVEGDLRREITMNIKKSKNGDKLNVAISGRIDTSTAPEVDAFVNENLDGVSSLTLDFKEITMNIKRLMEIGCYRGIRHRRNLPVRGQRTKTNARTCKGRKRTVGGRKK